MITLPQTVTSLPLISILLITLPLGAGLIWLLPQARFARRVALVTAIIDLGVSLLLLAGFDSGQTGFQFTEHADWIPTLNVYYHVGIDGLSVLMLPLTVVLFIGTILSSWNSARTMPRLYYTLLLLLESATLGVFCALDNMLFFLFWELTLIPLYFLISLWGVGPDRRYAAVKYTLFMLAGGVLLLLGFVVLAYSYAHQPGISTGPSFDYQTLVSQSIPPSTQVAVFFLLLLGFSAKVPLFPFHTWLPTVASEGPVTVSSILVGLKLGAFAMIRYLVPLAPDAAQQYHWLLAGFGATGMLYGAVLAMAQTNLRRMLAYASVSHVGLVVLGIASFSLQGIQGALFQLLNFTVIAGGLFLLTGFLHQRTGSTDIASLGGVAVTMPLLTGFFFVLGIASLGMPGTSGFPAEFLMLVSALDSHTGAGLAALMAMILGAGYFLGIYRKAFLGPVNSNIIGDAPDLRGREILVVLVFTGLVLLAGIFPDAVLQLTLEAASAWIETVRH